MNQTIEAPSYRLIESVLVTIRGGLCEVFSPGGVTLLLLFLIVLFYASRREVLGKTAWTSILTAAVFKILFFLGVFDFFLNWRFVNYFWDICYLVIIGSFLLAGLVLFRDWLVFLKKEDVSLLKVAPPQGNGKGHALSFWMIGLIMVLTVLAVVIQVSWPPDSEAVYRVFSAVHYHLWKRLFLLLFLYSGSFVLPFVILLKGWRYLMAAQSEGFFYAHWSKCLIISSALFLGYGLSMLSYFIPF